MNWLRDNGFTIGTHNSYEKGYYFSIERSTPKSIFKNVLSLLQEYSKSKNIDLGWVDVDNDDLNYKWIDDKNKILGLYRIYEYKIDDYLLSVRIDGDFEYLQNFYKKLIHMGEGVWIERCEKYQWEEFEEYLEARLFDDFLYDLGNLLKNLTIVRCAGNSSVFEGESGTSYFILFGYNSNIGCGEGWVIEDYVPY